MLIMVVDTPPWSRHFFVHFWPGLRTASAVCLFIGSGILPSWMKYRTSGDCFQATRGCFLATEHGSGMGTNEA